MLDTDAVIDFVAVGAAGQPACLAWVLVSAALGGEGVFAEEHVGVDDGRVGAFAGLEVALVPGAPVVVVAG